MHFETKCHKAKNVGNFILFLLLGVKIVIGPTVLLVQLKTVNYNWSRHKKPAAILKLKTLLIQIMFVAFQKVPYFKISWQLVNCVT